MCMHCFMSDLLRPYLLLPSPHAAETASPVHSGALLSAELPHPPDAMPHRPGLVGVLPTSTQPLVSSLHSDVALESDFKPSPPAWPSPSLGLPSSNTVVERAETASQEQVTPEARGTEASVNSPPPEVVAALVAEWRLCQSQLHPRPDAVTPTARRSYTHDQTQ